MKRVRPTHSLTQKKMFRFYPLNLFIGGTIATKKCVWHKMAHTSLLVFFISFVFISRIHKNFHFMLNCIKLTPSFSAINLKPAFFISFVFISRIHNNFHFILNCIKINSIFPCYQFKACFIHQFCYYFKNSQQFLNCVKIDSIFPCYQFEACFFP